MTAFRPWHPGTPPSALSEGLFDGAITVFSGIAATARLGDRARELLRGAFATDDPPCAEVELDGDEFRRRALKARRLVAEDDAIGAHWRETLAAIGYSPDSVWRDRMRLRVVPSLASPSHGKHRRLGVLAPHRDTWGSGIGAQINWWLPLYPLAPARTMLIWPALFGQPVANDSDAWQFRQAHADKSYPLLPTACQRPKAPAVPVLIEPDELLAFSAAHLHGGTADESRRSRFSLDSRIVWEADRRHQRGAPNVDSHARAQHWSWFKAPSGHALADTA